MSGHQTQILEIDGMHCDACVRRVAQALGAVQGARVDSVHVGQATVTAEPGSEPKLQEAVAQAGFSIRSIHGQS